MIDKAYMDIRRYYGTREKLTLTFEDEAGNPIDIAATYDNIILQTRKGRRDDGVRSLEMNLSLLNNTIRINNSNKIILDIDDKPINPGTYPYDIFVKIKGASDFQVYITGMLIIEPNVTEP